MVNTLIKTRPFASFIHISKGSSKFDRESTTAGNIVRYNVGKDTFKPLKKHRHYKRDELNKSGMLVDESGVEDGTLMLTTIEINPVSDSICDHETCEQSHFSFGILGQCKSSTLGGASY